MEIIVICSRNVDQRRNLKEKETFKKESAALIDADIQQTDIRHV